MKSALSKKTPIPDSESKAERHVHIRIVCQKPPDPEKHEAVFGLQDNSTTKEWVIRPGKLQANGNVHFECECLVRSHQKTGDPNFLGGFVHGTPSRRFLYLSWRPKNGRLGQPESPTAVWSRRMKIHLSTITWEQIDQVAKTGGVLEATVAGTGRGGSPNCATVPLLSGGWNVTRT